MFVRPCALAAAFSLLFTTCALGNNPSALWGRIANSGFEEQRIRTALFFPGQARDGTNPYGLASAPTNNMGLYTAHPTDDRHLRWSESAANRDSALWQMAASGLNVVTMSSWGESFLDKWSLYAPMQSSPGSHNELFAAAVGKPLLITPLIESRADWTFYNEFPTFNGVVAPGTVSQIVNLVDRYLRNANHPEWANEWTQVYDRDGQPRYAISLIHASSNRLAADQHAAFAAGFDLMADEVFARTGVKVGFLLDALPTNSFAPGTFRPTPEQTGPELAGKSSILGIQCFIPEIWANVANEAARLAWKRDFSSRWAATGIPFLMDVAPGYDAHIVFPGSVQYGHNQAWLDGLKTMVEDFGQDGLVYNSWNGYTEAMVAVESNEHADAYRSWLGELTAIHDTTRPWPVPGDANKDGVVDKADSILLASHWGQANATWAMGDFDGDGLVGPADAAILAANWSRAATETAAVPEPCLPVLLLGSLLAIALFRPSEGR